MATSKLPTDGPPTRPTLEISQGGLFDGFESYRTPTDADYHHVLTSGLVVPDTNVFLNLYRYNDHTRSDLLKLFRSLGDNLWVPRQVIFEFWRNREKVLQDARDTNKTVKELTGQREKAIETIRAWTNRVKLPSEQIQFFTDELSRTYGTIIQGVSELTDRDAAESARNTNRDPVIKELEEILRGRVGEPLNASQYAEAIVEAKRRGEHKIPPGYRDIGKIGDEIAGDYLIWIQVLNEAKRQSKDVLIVTGDIKEDWWRRERGELRGPRAELAEEIRKCANVRLFMLQPDSLLRYGEQTLNLSISDKSVEDIERVEKYLADADANDSINLIKVVDNWHEILNALKRRRRVAWMLVSNVNFMSMSGDILTIGFPREGSVKGFESSGCDADLAKAVEEVVDLEVRIKSVLTEGDAKFSGGGVASSNADDPSLERSPPPTTGFSDEPPF